jgi:hypothetical protein
MNFEQEIPPQMQTCQGSLMENLVSYFKPDADVLGLLLFGSFSQPDHHSDHWSDIDLLIVIQDGKLDKFFPTVEWANSFGKIYTYSQSSDPFKCTTRVCFEDFSRIDFLITTESDLAAIDQWPDVPFFSGVKAIFSRSNVVDRAAAQKYAKQELPPVRQEQFVNMVRDFRFKSMLAVYKVVRGDLLIALHLTQDLIRDCSVLGMMLRDRATGTNIHKQGGMGNELVSRLEAAQKPFTSLGILDSIQASNVIFEKLACEWSDNYQENRQPLLEWVERAKVELHL